MGFTSFLMESRAFSKGVAVKSTLHVSGLWPPLTIAWLWCSRSCQSLPLCHQLVSPDRSGTVGDRQGCQRYLSLLFLWFRAWHRCLEFAWLPLFVGCAWSASFYSWNQSGPLLTIAYTCDSNGVMTAKSTSQGHISNQNKIQQAENVS